MSRFKCTSPDCTFDVEIPNAPPGADACRCQLCGEQAILVDSSRPAFKCSACNHIFRNSGSTNPFENCSQCGAVAPRLFSENVSEDSLTKMVVTGSERGPTDALGFSGELAEAFWESPAGAPAKTQGYGVCDFCNGNISVGEGHLTGPIGSEDPYPSMACGDCFKSRGMAPWDGDVSRMPPDQAEKFGPVVRLINPA